jgi:segregation and condensation protein B
MKKLLEAYLFVATEPIIPSVFAKALQYDLDDVAALLDELVQEYEDRRGGLKIIRLAHGYQMATSEELAEDLARLIDNPGNKNRLSKPALETLAVIAYRQPITAAEVESVRGVAVDGVLKTLTERKMIYEQSRKQVPGRPILYATTHDFLHYFGLESISDLPPLDAEVDVEMQQAIAVIEESVGLVEE